jgi:hypothetical protein
MPKDRRSAGPRPPFPHQQQSPPGKTHALEPAHVFLASDEATFIAGATLPAAAGWPMM